MGGRDTDEAVSVKARQGAAGTQGGAVEAERHLEGRARDIQQLEVTWGGYQDPQAPGSMAGVGI